MSLGNIIFSKLVLYFSKYLAISTWRCAVTAARNKLSENLFAARIEIHVVVILAGIGFFVDRCGRHFSYFSFNIKQIVFDEIQLNHC